MTEISVYDKIMDSIDTIFAFALKRTRDRYEAEDLSQEILMSLYSSANSLRDNNAFYGWMWAVAGNVYKSYLRKREKHNSLTLDENSWLPAHELIEDDLVDREQLGILYKELSLLSGLYRETTIMYYIKDKDCQEISQELNISLDMVKQYLFKSRKKIKEGMSMQRESGEKSFNPKKFLLYFWGAGGNYNSALFKRRLPGNIMLEAYYSPIGVEQLSLELGVATPYLEDEVGILLKHELLQQTKNNKLQSNIVIFTREFEDELFEKVQKTYIDAASFLYEFITENEQSIRSIGFKGNEMNKNTLLWQMTTLILVEALAVRLERDMIQSFPPLNNGASGYQWGIERGYGDLDFELSFMGYGDKEGNELRVIDYFIVPKKHEVLCRNIAGDVILKIAKGQVEGFNQYEEEELPSMIQNGYVHSTKGHLDLSFPVYTAAEFQVLIEKLQPAIEYIDANCKSILPTTIQVLKNHVPPYLQEQLTVIAYVKQLEAFMVNTLRNMYDNEQIHIPNPCRESLGTFVVLV